MVLWSRSRMTAPTSSSWRSSGRCWRQWRCWRRRRRRRQRQWPKAGRRSPPRRTPRPSCSPWRTWPASRCTQTRGTRCQVRPTRTKEDKEECGELRSRFVAYLGLPPRTPDLCSVSDYAVLPALDVRYAEYAAAAAARQTAGARARAVEVRAVADGLGARLVTRAWGNTRPLVWGFGQTRGGAVTAPRPALLSMGSPRMRVGATRA